MTAIGGYFELEPAPRRGSFHPGALAVACGRACLRIVLEHLRPRRVWVPFYACDSLYEALEDTSTPYVLYRLDERLEPAGPLALEPGELFVYVNYFGIKDAAVRRLRRALGECLIVDDTQAFFHRESEPSWAFNSARKFFGVPDGAYLYSPEPLEPIRERTRHFSVEHLVGRLTGSPGEAYPLFKRNEALMSAAPLGMSRVSQQLLEALDYETIAARRRDNLERLHSAFGTRNQLELHLQDFGAPLCYPFLPSGVIDKRRLLEREIFVPTYWPEVMTRSGAGFELERDLARRLLPLPLDQRYGAPEMDRLVEEVVRLLDG